MVHTKSSGAFRRLKVRIHAYRWAVKSRLPVTFSQNAAKKILDELVEFIPKPVDRNRLVATVNRFIPIVR